MFCSASSRDSNFGSTSQILTGVRPDSRMSSLPSEKDKKRKRREEKDGRPRKKKSHREDAEAIANGNTPAQNCIKLTHVPKDDHFMLVVGECARALGKGLG